MKAIFITEYGGNDVIQYGERPAPAVGPKDLLVEVRAAGVNPVDYKIRDGAVKVLVKDTFPLVLGSELSGVVVSCGAEVKRFKQGDEIYARLDKNRIGAYAELAVVGEDDAALKPKNASFEEAAALPLVGLTTWQAMRELGNVQAGQKVFIHAGSGGIGTFAIQLAKHLGATVATTASPRNFELVKRLGADVVIDYKSQRFEDVLKDYDFVFDTLAGDEQARSFQVLKRGGVMVSIAGKPTAKFAKAWGLNPALVVVLGLMGRKTTKLAEKHGVRFEYLFMRPDGKQLGEIAGLVERGVIRPVLDKVFPLEKTAEALAYSASGRAVGKVIIRVKPAVAIAA